MIKKLPSNLINQIAAGEVVDDPKSIIKELVENSIDAKSKTIKIFIEKGGIDKIIVIDDGIGIKKEELKLAFERFATSKISSEKDLSAIQTLGFRGEALPSIASVSNLTLKSIHHKKKSGYKINYNAGIYNLLSPSSIENGTTIEIRDLFYNVPARKKFLKSEQYEYRKILKLFKSIALANPEINLLLNHNNREIFNFESEMLINRISSIYGKKVSESCIKVDYKKEDYIVSGYIGSLSLVKKRRENQFTFINNRYAENKLINSAVYNSYRSLLDRGEFPFFILFLNLPGNYIDINVHPKKEEVKFRNELQIQFVVKKAVSEKLKNIIPIMPNYSSVQISRINDENPMELPFDNISLESKNVVSMESNSFDENIKNAEIRFSKDKDDNKSIMTNNIWQIHNKYILTEIKSGIIIVDQHVAHERILYENAKDALEGDGLESQSILFPKTIDFSESDFTYINEILDYLKKIGFNLRIFGHKSIIIEGVPVDLPYGREEEVINDILDHYIKTKSTNSSFIEYMAATYACKAAIKAGDKLDDKECITLIDRLFSTKHPYYCPHGRPIIINLTLDDLDSRFERH